MAKGGYVLEMLRPNGGWVITEDDFDSIRWDDGVEPVTRAEFDEVFNQVDAWKAQKEAEAQIKRQSVLDRLGITEEEARLILD